MRVKMQQPAYKCEKMQMRALFVNGPIPGWRREYYYTFAYCRFLHRLLLIAVHVGYMANSRLVVLVSHGILSLTWNKRPCGTLAPRPIAGFANKCQLREEPSFKYILRHVNQLRYNIGYCYSQTGCFIISFPNFVLVGLCGAVQAFRARPFVLWLQFWLMNSKASAAWRDWKLKSISVHSVLSWLSRYQRWQTLQNSDRQSITDTCIYIYSTTIPTAQTLQLL